MARPGEGGGDWYAARGRPHGSESAGAWYGTAFGDVPPSGHGQDRSFLLTTLPIGDSLFGTMDPWPRTAQQVRIHGRVAGDSILFDADSVLFRGVVFDTILSGRWTWTNVVTGDVAESTWTARRLERSWSRALRGEEPKRR